MSKYSEQVSGVSTEVVRRRFVLTKTSINVGLVALLFFTSSGAFFRFGAMTGLIWTAATALACYWFLSTPRLMSRLLAEHWLILLLPLFAILSTAWSGNKSVTLQDGVQLLFTTIISLRIVTTLDTRQIMIALMLGMVGPTALSVLNLISGFLPPVYELNGALLGIFTQKNIFAKAVFWGSFAVMALCLMNRRPMVGIVFMVATFPLTVLALSKTGQIGYGFIVLLLVLSALRRLSITTRILLPAMCVLTFAALALIYIATGGSLFAEILALLGKNSTLTGRTVIWALGFQVWQDNMLVGIGMDTFWTSPTYANQVAFISANVEDGVEGFHNAYVEILVAMGSIGGVYFIGMIGTKWIMLMRAYLATRSLNVAIWLAVLTAVAALGMFEDSFFRPRSGHMMFAIMSFAYAKRLGR